jgi:hypothetical protein
MIARVALFIALLSWIGMVWCVRRARQWSVRCAWVATVTVVIALVALAVGL